MVLPCLIRLQIMFICRLALGSAVERILFTPVDTKKNTDAYFTEHDSWENVESVDK